jgi:hypothetical protein
MLVAEDFAGDGGLSEAAEGTWLSNFWGGTEQMEPQHSSIKS